MEENVTSYNARIKEEIKSNYSSEQEEQAKAYYDNTLPVIKELSSRLSKVKDRGQALIDCVNNDYDVPLRNFFQKNPKFVAVKNEKLIAMLLNKAIEHNAQGCLQTLIQALRDNEPAILDYFFKTTTAINKADIETTLLMLDDEGLQHKEKIRVRAKQLLEEALISNDFKQANRLLKKLYKKRNMTLLGFAINIPNPRAVRNVLVNDIEQKDSLCAFIKGVKITPEFFVEEKLKDNKLDENKKFLYRQINKDLINASNGNYIKIIQKQIDRKLMRSLEQEAYLCIKQALEENNITQLRETLTKYTETLAEIPEHYQQDFVSLINAYYDKTNLLKTMISHFDPQVLDKSFLLHRVILDKKKHSLIIPLLKAGANPKYKDPQHDNENYRYTPIDLAADKQDITTITNSNIMKSITAANNAKLIWSRPNLDKDKYCEDVKNALDKVKNALEKKEITRKEALEEYIQYDADIPLKRFLKNNQNYVAKHPDTSYHLIHAAIQSFSQQCLETLLLYTPKSTLNTYPFLHTATMINNVKAAEALLAQGADPYIPDQCFKQSPLEIALRLYRPKIIPLMLAAANLEKKPETPLHAAIDIGKTDLIRLLLSREKYQKELTALSHGLDPVLYVEQKLQNRQLTKTAKLNYQQIKEDLIAAQNTFLQSPQATQQQYAQAKLIEETSNLWQKETSTNRYSSAPYNPAKEEENKENENDIIYHSSV